MRKNLAATTLACITLFLLSGPVCAQSYLYTYEGNEFTTSIGPPFPSSPAIGDHITIQFTLTEDQVMFGESPMGINSVDIPYTMSCGELSMLSTEPDASPSNLVLSLSPSTGLPTSWGMSISEYPYMIASYMPPNWPSGNTSQDEVNYTSWDNGLPQYSQLHNMASLGIWTREAVVPIPGAVWLFGSGLLGLIGIRRKIQS